MNYPVQIQCLTYEERWQTVATWDTAQRAIQDAIAVWSNPDHPQSRDVAAVRVVTDDSPLRVLYQRRCS